MSETTKFILAGVVTVLVFLVMGRRRSPEDVSIGEITSSITQVQPTPDFDDLIDYLQKAQKCESRYGGYLIGGYEGGYHRPSVIPLGGEWLCVTPA